MFFYYINTYYYNILVLLLFFSILFFLLGATYLLSYQYNLVHFDKFSAFECGFDPFTDTKSTFSVRYFLVAILFTVFDIETVLLLPFIIQLFNSSVSIIILLYIFLFIIFLGFFYEVRKYVIDFY